MFEQTFKNIDDVLRKEAGCASELDYTEQSSWLLFLKYLDALERDKASEAELEGKKYTHILDKPYRWDTWAAPKGTDGKIDHNVAMVGDDFTKFVNNKLFPYLQAFKQKASGPNTIEYKSAKSSGNSPTASRAATTCGRSSTTLTSYGSGLRRKSMSCRICTKPRSRTWATPGGTAASTTRLDR